MLLGADHMSDAHGGIVDDAGEIVGGQAIGTQQHEVADHAGREAHFVTHHVVEHPVAIGHHETHTRGPALAIPRRLLSGSEVAAGAVVVRRAAGGERFGATLVQLRVGAKAAVGELRSE